MEHVDTLITAGWLVPVDAEGTHRRDQGIAIRDGQILDVGPSAHLRSRYKPAELVELPDEGPN